MTSLGEAGVDAAAPSRVLRRVAAPLREQVVELLREDIVEQRLRPVEPLIASSIVYGSRPNRWPTRITSELARKCVAESRLLSAFSACPAPTGPAWTTFPPTASKIGRHVSRSASAPPHMIVSVPASAPTTPPETGAST